MRRSPDGVVPLDRVVAVHVDTPRTADADPDDDLAWYATQEIPDLISTTDFDKRGPTGDNIASWTLSPSRRLPSTSRT